MGQVKKANLYIEQGLKRFTFESSTKCATRASVKPKCLDIALQKTVYIPFNRNT